MDKMAPPPPGNHYVWKLVLDLMVHYLDQQQQQQYQFQQQCQQQQQQLQQQQRQHRRASEWGHFDADHRDDFEDLNAWFLEWLARVKPTSELMAAIQLGIGQSVGGLSAKPERDVLMQDFGVVEVVFFPVEGSNSTPAHHHSDFRFKTYAPVAFRYFRDLFGIQPDDFMLSLCDDPLKELSNPGASGSIFYLTSDDEFIIKTVQHKEAEFLQKLLPGYFLNISQNKRTLLPKFYGLYCYQCGGKNIRFAVMNNLLPSTVKLHEKYDMKGSTYKRKASKSERSKSCPTLKDLDFLDIHPEGLLLEKDTYDALIETLKRDCRVLESFKIMDYSLLVGIYNLDQVNREKHGVSGTGKENATENNPPGSSEAVESGPNPGSSLHRAKSMRTRIGQYSTPLESIQGNTDLTEDTAEDEDVPPGGIPARNAKGERLLLYLGIIDILQSFRLKKRLEHTVKSMVIDGDTISVHRPSYYAERFLRYHSTSVFKKVQTGLKHSPSKKRSMMKTRTSGMPHPTQTETSEQQYSYRGERSSRTISFSDEQSSSGAMSGRPDLLPEYSKVQNRSPSPRSMRSELVQNLNGNSRQGKKSEAFNLTNYPSEDALSAGTASTASLRGVGPYGPARGVSPPLSLSESTPTHTDFTEGTPSFTNSSPSCSSDVMADIGNPNILDAMGSPTSSSRSPDLRRHGNSSGRHVPQQSRSPTGAPLHSSDFSKTNSRSEITVTVIPESPPPPFESVVGADINWSPSRGSVDRRQETPTATPPSERRGGESSSSGGGNGDGLQQESAAALHSPSSQSPPSSSATLGPGDEDASLVESAAASEHEMTRL